MPIRQITICSLIFLAILLTGFWLNYHSNQATQSPLFFANWKSDLMLSEELRANSTSAPFLPREYVRILREVDDILIR